MPQPVTDLPSPTHDPLAGETAFERPAALEHAIALVADDLVEVEQALGRLLHSSITVIPRVGGHLAFAGGKRFRPLVTLLAAQAAGHDEGTRITVAAVAELLHTATLLHDDVIDGGEFRRGRPAARMPYGNGMAVLTGDYCLARGLQAMAATGRIEGVRSMSDAVTLMAEGEVAQLDVAGDWTMDRKRYYMVIERKTAALIAWCSSVASLVDPRYRPALHRYGMEVGFAFQIADDVLDYASDLAQSGKARGQDLREGKLTLPLLIACEQNPEVRERVRELLAMGPSAPDDAVNAVLDEVVAGPGPERATAIATSHARAAVASLSVLPDNPAKQALAALARAVARRSR